LAMGSEELFDQVGIELWSSQSQSPE
jgi:hypothetical protein